MSHAGPEDLMIEPAAQPTTPPFLPLDAVARGVFPLGGGEVGERLRAHDWQRSPLGPPAGWPAALRTTLRILLNLSQPALLYWGERQLCFYNDASRRFLGASLHATLLGRPARQAWGVGWDAIAAQVHRVLEGTDAHWSQTRPGSHENGGQREPVAWSCFGSPVEDDSAAAGPAGVGGVFVLCSERPAPAAPRLPGEERRWQTLFDRATGLICVLSGPQHRFAYVNPRYMALANGRAVIGKTLVECLPEVTAQGLVERLDEVYRTGTTHSDSGAPIRLAGSAATDSPLRYLDGVYQPIRDDSGTVTGIFVEGHDVTERALATLALRETLESIADGFAAFDSHWCLNYLNPAGVRLLGIDAAQLQGRPFGQLFASPEGADALNGQRLAAQGGVREFEHLDAVRGQWLNVRCCLRRGGGVAVYFQDRTARKQAELARQASEQRERERAEELEAVMRSVPAFIWIAHDPHCERITGNPQSTRLVRMDADANASASAAAPAPLHRPFREYIDGRPADPQELPMQRAAREGVVVPQAEISFVFDDGSVCHLYGGAAPLYDQHGAVRGAVGAFVDITGFKAAQSQLEMHERELRTLADNTPDILSRFDRQHRHTFVNAAVERATGRPPHEFLGKTQREMGMPAELVNRWESALQRVFDTGRACRIELSMPVRGAVRAYLTRLLPEPGADGHVGQVLAIAQDVTEQRQAEMAVRIAERRKDEFLATLAHELRNPLAPLRTGLHILEREPDAQTATTVRLMMNRQLSTMVRLIDELLDVSRISAGKMTLRQERVSLQDVAGMAIETSASVLQASEHRLNIDRDSEPVWVRADPMRLAQVVSHLLHNAAKYTPPGGCITLSVVREGDTAVLRVSDNGLGIPPHLLGDVFHMFAQVNRTLKRAQGGLGVGLALARNIVGLHGGTVEARSGGLGEGSVFTVRLPALPIEPTLSDGGVPVEPLAMPPEQLRILVVDDNHDAADRLAMLLRLGGHEVRAAYDGAAALCEAGDWSPDVAFLDISLPGMSGFDLARALCLQLAPLPVCLVALTGHGTPVDAWRSREAGFAIHLTKPVATDAVEKVLTAVREQRCAA